NTVSLPRAFAFWVVSRIGLALRAHVSMLGLQCSGLIMFVCALLKIPSLGGVARSARVGKGGPTPLKSALVQGGTPFSSWAVPPCGMLVLLRIPSVGGVAQSAGVGKGGGKPPLSPPLSKGGRRFPTAGHFHPWTCRSVACTALLSSWISLFAGGKILYAQL